MNLFEFLQNNIVLLDGAMGTVLQKNGLAVGERCEDWNILHAEKIINVHKQYYDAGSNIVNTNTFGANTLKYSEDELDGIICAAVENAKRAKELSAGKNKYISLDVGPLGRLLKPYGDLDFNDAVNIFAKTVKAGVKYGVDAITIETMNDCYETKAAVIAAKENCDLPIIVTNSYQENGRLLSGTEPKIMVAMLESLGVAAVGINCSLAPDKMLPILNEYIKYASVPVIFKPNAGMPSGKLGEAEYTFSAEQFAKKTVEAANMGARLLGGCCGTDSNYISQMAQSLKGVEIKPIKSKNKTFVSSGTKTVEIDGIKPVLIGERINPTGKKMLKQAIIDDNVDYILSEAISQAELGAEILDVNMGVPEIDEGEKLEKFIKEIQAVTEAPLQIDTSDTVALEKALRIYNGKPLVNSVNGKQESMDSVFPLVKKYGGAVVCLCLDEDGIPDSAEERLNIANKIYKNAEKYGISKKDLLFDALALTVSANSNAAKITADTIALLTSRGFKTVLGVSNVSFGLPERNKLNSAFLLTCFAKGLSAAIVNPKSEDMLSAYYSYCTIIGRDENCNKYIEHFSDNQSKQVADVTLKEAVEQGLVRRATDLAKEMLKSKSPLEIINNNVIPALDNMGIRFENNQVFLPQLLISAETASAVFNLVKKYIPKSEAKKCCVVLATVKGDIHDIGKNIVKLLLENYGFEVHDLGKDVSPERIAQEVKKTGAPLLGLSALMTTTLPGMKETVDLVKKETPSCKIVVGGAVLTEEYASMIGADKYAKDATETVKFAEKIFSSR